MKNLRLTASLLCFAATLAACAPVTMAPQGDSAEIYQETQREKEMAFKQLITDNDRVYNVAFPILSANTDFCEKIAPDFGFTLWNLQSQKRDFTNAARTVYNLQDAVALQFVADRSPAGRARMQSGDFITAIDDEQVPVGDGAVKAAYDMLDRAGDKPVKISAERNGKPYTVTLKPVTVCAYPVVLDSNSNDINAFTDGSKIVLSKGILRFTRNDNELAMVVAHELGHDAMNHIGKQRTNAMLGSLGGLAIDAVLAGAGVSSGGQFGQAGTAIGGGAYAVQFEQEADYVGMYFMTRAGYNTQGVADFWRRLAAEVPSSVTIRQSHPTSPERFIAIERTAKEVARKRASGQPLVPNLKQESN